MCFYRTPLNSIEVSNSVHQRPHSSNATCQMLMLLSHLIRVKGGNLYPATLFPLLLEPLSPKIWASGQSKNFSYMNIYLNEDLYDVLEKREELTTISSRFICRLFYKTYIYVISSRISIQNSILAANSVLRSM